MALLLILFALFSFVGFGTSLNGTSTATKSATATGTTITRNSVQTNGVTKTTCIVVTWKRGEPAHRRPCHKASAKP